MIYKALFLKSKHKKFQDLCFCQHWKISHLSSRVMARIVLLWLKSGQLIANQIWEFGIVIIIIVIIIIIIIIIIITLLLLLLMMMMMMITGAFFTDNNDIVKGRKSWFWKGTWLWCPWTLSYFIVLLLTSCQVRCGCGSCWLLWVKPILP